MFADIYNNIMLKNMTQHDKPQTGVFINCDKENFDIMIINGDKTIETRNRNTLKKFIGQRVGLVRTHVSKKDKRNVLFAYATIGEPIKYDNKEEFEKDYEKHKISPNSKYFIKTKKIGYPLINVEKVEPYVLPKRSNKSFVYRPLNEEINYNEYGAIEYSWDFDEDGYADFLEEEGLERNEETLKEYIDYFVTVEIEFFDCETFHQVNYESMSVSDLEDYFGEKVAKIIIEDLKEKGEGKYEMAYLYDDDEIDINNPNELNARAKAVLRNGAYFKGCRGFILTDGTIVYTPTEHNEIEKINGIEDKFQFIHLGNIRIISDGLDVWTPPTLSQWPVISQVLRAYRGESFYLSLYSDREYCVSYRNLYVDKAIEDIERFFNEGKVPQMVQEGRKIHITKDQLNMIKENIEQEVEPSDVDLSSFDVEKSLYPKLWNENNELDSRARLQLLDIADDFIETLNVRWVKPIDIRLYGSICSYNWSEFSDIDMHVVMDFSEVDERVDLVEDYFNAKKNAWNETHKELKIYGLPVELYVEDVTAETNSEGIYSLNKNGWLKEPDPNDIEPIEDTEAIKNGTADLMTLIDDLIEEYETTSDKHIIGEIGEDVDKILKFLKELRKTSLEQGGEMSNGNISYKTLRRFGYLDKLYDLSAKCYDAVNSLEENKRRI